MGSPGIDISKDLGRCPDPVLGLANNARIAAWQTASDKEQIPGTPCNRVNKTNRPSSGLLHECVTCSLCQPRHNGALDSLFP